MNIKFDSPGTVTVSVTHEPKPVAPFGVPPGSRLLLPVPSNTTPQQTYVVSYARGPSEIGAGGGPGLFACECLAYKTKSHCRHIKIMQGAIETATAAMVRDGEVDFTILQKRLDDVENVGR